jgi:hypothetical protein
MEPGMSAGQSGSGTVAPKPAAVSPPEPAPAPAPWPLRRLFPLLATAALVVIGMTSTTIIGPHLIDRTAWSLPEDLWGTLVAASRLVHLDLSGLYTQPTGLVTFPGAAVILAPAVAVTDAAGLSLQHPGPHNTQPTVWLVAGTYMIIISAVALFAADALAERLGARRGKRAFLAAASGVVLWNVSVEWGHPEDAVAVGLLLFAILALSDAKPARAAWLTGAAIAVQPLVLLALPIMLAVVEPRRLAGFLARAAAPATVLLGAAAAANWTATYHAVTRQPNWPSVDHPTPWTPLAPHMAGGAVADGPARALAILVACGCAIIVGRRLGPARHGATWSWATLREVLWWAAVALALRSVFEPVMVAYYLWPGLAVALITAARSWPRLLSASAIAVAVTFGSQSSWRSPWGWWGSMVAGLALTLIFACVPLRRTRPEPASPAPPPQPA